MLEIMSKNNQKIKDACALKMKKVRQEKGLFLMEGVKNLDMALKFGVVKQIFTSIGCCACNNERISKSQVGLHAMEFGYGGKSHGRSL